MCNFDSRCTSYYFVQWIQNSVSLITTDSMGYNQAVYRYTCTCTFKKKKQNIKTFHNISLPF